MSVLLTRPYAPSGDFAACLRGKNQPSGGKCPNAMAASRLHGWLGDCGDNLKHVRAAREELRQVVGFSVADEIEKLDRLKKTGAITDREFALLRAKLVQ